MDMKQVVEEMPVSDEQITYELKEFATERILRKRVLCFLKNKFEEVEKTGKSVCELKVSADVFGIMRKRLLLYDDMELETKAEELMKGSVGSIWGAKIVIPAGPSFGICEVIGSDD